MTCLFLAASGVTVIVVRCDVRKPHAGNTVALLHRPQLSKTHENEKLCCIPGIKQTVLYGNFIMLGNDVKN